MADKVWGYKDDQGAFTESDPYADDTAGSNADYFNIDYATKAATAAKKYADVAVQSSLEKTRGTAEEQRKGAAQQQGFSQSDKERDYRQAQQAYRY